MKLSVATSRIEEQLLGEAPTDTVRCRDGHKINRIGLLDTEAGQAYDRRYERVNLCLCQELSEYNGSFIRHLLRVFKQSSVRYETNGERAPRA